MTAHPTTTTNAITTNGQEADNLYKVNKDIKYFRSECFVKTFLLINIVHFSVYKKKHKQERIQYVFQRPTPYLCQHVQPKKAKFAASANTHSPAPAYWAMGGGK